MTHFVNPKEVQGDLVPPRRSHRRAAPITASSASATRSSCARRSECCHRGWGVPSSSASRGRAGDQTRPFQLVTGRVRKGIPSGGARGRTDVPKIVDWYMDKKIDIDRARHPRDADRRDQLRLRAHAQETVDPRRRHAFEPRPRSHHAPDRGGVMVTGHRRRADRPPPLTIPTIPPPAPPKPAHRVPARRR